MNHLVGGFGSEFLGREGKKLKINIFAICRAVDCLSLGLELGSNNVLFKSRQIDISSLIINLEDLERKLSLVCQFTIN